MFSGVVGYLAIIIPNTWNLIYITICKILHYTICPPRYVPILQISYVITKTDRNVRSFSNCSLTEKSVSMRRWYTHFSCIQGPLHGGPTLTCSSWMLSHIWKNYNHSLYMIVHPYTEITVCKHFLMRHFMEEGFGCGGFRGPLTSHHWISSCAGYVKGLCVQNFCGWRCKPMCKDNWEKLMCGKMNVDHIWTEPGYLHDVIRPLDILMLRWNKTCINV
jgi:hypothetical protein